MLEETTFDTGEVAINYAAGPQAGPPVLLLHGIQGRWQGVEALVDELPRRWTVYALDLRGHGKSGHATGHYSLLDYARDVDAFVAHLAEPAVLIGHSLGASIALAAAARYPRSARAVVLLDPPIDVDAAVHGRPQVAAQLRYLRDSLRKSPSVEQIATQLQRVFPQMDQAGRTAYADQLARLDPDALDAFAEGRTFAGFSVEESLRQVRCPLLLLYGEWDLGGVVRDEDTSLVRANLPSAAIAKVAGGGHMFFGEQPDAVRRHLDAFLAQV